MSREAESLNISNRNDGKFTPERNKRQLLQQQRKQERILKNSDIRQDQTGYNSARLIASDGKPPRSGRVVGRRQLSKDSSSNFDVQISSENSRTRKRSGTV